MILSRIVIPKTKAELIRSLQRGTFRSFDIYEGSELTKLPVGGQLAKEGATVIVLQR